MIAYELRHTMYIWEDCTTEVNTLLFETEEDAIEYLNIKKIDIIDEYCEHLNLQHSSNSSIALRQYILSTSEETYNDYTEEDDYFYVELEEFGHDILEITKKELLKFN